jgi:hypothetical protein
MTPYDTTADPSEHRCVLEGRAFSYFHDIMFRRSETDGRAVMTIRMGDKEAMLPLGSLKREFAIADDSADGRMFDLIEQSLDFVCGLSIGDPLPREVIDGGASWEPSDVHRARARGRLRRVLITWLDRELGADSITQDAISGLAEDSRLRQRVAEALTHAAKTLDLANSAAVVERFEALGEEFAYIEALRDRLLEKVSKICERLTTLATGFRGDGDRADTMTQVRRLAGVSLRQIACRFEDVESQSKDILVMLGDGENQQSFIRSNRDWLYTNLRGWEPLFLEWAAVGFGLDDHAWQVIGKTYHFLAQRYMPVQEWKCLHAVLTRRKSTKTIHAMQW